MLKKLPFVLLDFDKPKQKELYDKVVRLTRKVYEINERLIINADRASRNVLEKEKNSTISEIEQLITKVYRQEF